MEIIIVLFIIAVVLGLFMLLGALTVATANAWFLHGNFVDGWVAAWDKPWVLLGFGVLFFGVLAGILRSDS